MARPAQIMEIGMIARRDIILGGACLVAGGAAAGLKVRKKVSLLGARKMAEVVPSTFENWTSQDIGDPYAINGPGTLSSQLYNEIVTREYRHSAGGASILALFAYGRNQSDDLQLNRPEVCYPAFGYNIVRNEPHALSIGGSASVPTRRLAAEAEGRRENVVYWSRMGELIPQDGGQQRLVRLKIAMQGIIPDGLLCRFSISGDSPERDWRAIESFVARLVLAVPPLERKVLIGTERANQIGNGSASA